MHELTTSQSEVGAIAEEFIERVRQGETPDLNEYAKTYPQHADMLREIVPTLLALERLKPVAEPDSASDQTACASQVRALGQLGDYHIVREIGRGGMGIVYEATQRSLGRRVALKVLQHLVDNSVRQARFEREAKSAARLHHTNIVPVFGFGASNGLHYYAMQYIHGLGLDDVLKGLKQLRTDSQGQGPSTAKEETSESAINLTQQQVSLALTNALITDQFQIPNNASQYGGNETPTCDDQIAPVKASTQSSRKSPDDTAENRLSSTLGGSDSIPFPGLPQNNRGSRKKHYWRSIAKLGQQAGSALHYAHSQGVLHRDIKPSNLILDTSGTLWLTDFGLAKADDEQELTNTGDVLGTLRYMAPEAFEGNFDGRSDVYSLGLTMYELLVMQPAFNDSDRGRLIRKMLNETPIRLRTIDPTIPVDLQTVVHKAIHRDPNHRYATAQLFADDLQRFIDDQPIRARRISTLARLRHWTVRNPVVAGLTYAVALLLIAFAIGASFAASKFEKMANDNGQMAGSLKLALGTAEENLSLAANEQQRAEKNLELALKALDAVYLDAIGTEKLLGGNVNDPARLRTFTELERQLLRRGLEFYEQFAQLNDASQNAELQTAQAYYRVGLIQTGLGDLTEAHQSYLKSIEIFERLSNASPQESEIWRQLGDSHSQAARTSTDAGVRRRHATDSIAAYSQALLLNANESKTLIARGRARLYLGDFTKEMEEDFVRAAELDPTNAHAITWCVFYFAFHASSEHIDPKKAEHYAEKLLAIDPVSPAALNYLTTYSSSDDPKRADYRQRWFALDPPNPHAVLYQAREAFQEGDRESARQILGTIKVEPGGIGAAVANLHLSLGNPGEALRIALSDLESNPNASFPLQVSWKAQLDLGNYAEAIVACSRYCELRPDHTSWVGNHVAGALQLIKKQDPAKIGAAIDLLGRQSENIYARKWKAELLEFLERWEEADEDYKWLIEKQPDNITHFLDRSRIRLAAGDEAGADEVIDLYMQPYHQAIEKNENDAEAWNSRGVVYSRMDQTERAIPDIEVAQRLESGNVKYSKNLGILNAELGRYEKAAAAYGDVVELEPQNIAIRYPLALCRLAVGNHDGYRELCRHVVEIQDQIEFPDLNSAAWMLALAPISIEECEVATELSRRCVEGQPNDVGQLNTYGVLLYRAGRFEESFEVLHGIEERLGKNFNGNLHLHATDLYFMAMSKQALNDDVSAQRLLEEANSLTEQALSGLHSVSWSFKLELRLFRDEATALIAPKSSEDDCQDGDLPATAGGVAELPIGVGK